VAEFVEVETGKGSDALDRRPQLAAALAKARAGRCPSETPCIEQRSATVALAAALYRLAMPRLNAGNGEIEDLSARFLSSPLIEIAALGEMELTACARCGRMAPRRKTVESLFNFRMLV
jgi:hypothetical protein